MREQTRRYPFRDNKRAYVVQYADDTTLAYHQPAMESENVADVATDREGMCSCAKCAIDAYKTRYR